jgi:Helix-turn-helix domain
MCADITAPLEADDSEPPAGIGHNAGPPLDAVELDARLENLDPAQAIPARGAAVPRLFTRADALALLKIGETTLHWLQRTGKLRPIRIGSRVLFNASEINRLATHGATLTQGEKQAASKRRAVELPRRRRDRPRKAPLSGVPTA